MLPFELIKDTPYLALSGELWSVFYEYFNRNWSCYRGFLLYYLIQCWPKCLTPYFVTITKNQKICDHYFSGVNELTQEVLFLGWWSQNQFPVIICRLLPRNQNFSHSSVNPVQLETKGCGGEKCSTFLLFHKTYAAQEHVRNINSLRLSVAYMRQWNDLTVIGSVNGLSPGRRQAIIWTNAAILLIGPLGTKFNEFLVEIHTFSFKKMHLKIPSAKWPYQRKGITWTNTSH